MNLNPKESIKIWNTYLGLVSRESFHRIRWIVKTHTLFKSCTEVYIYFLRNMYRSTWPKSYGKNICFFFFIYFFIKSAFFLKIPQFSHQPRKKEKKAPNLATFSFHGNETLTWKTHTNFHYQYIHIISVSSFLLDLHLSLSLIIYKHNPLFLFLNIYLF